MEIVFYTLVFMMGSSIGSFLYACAYRLNNGISLTNPSRSFCPECKNNIKWHDLIPVLGYVLLKGKCRSCGSKIGAAHLYAEIANGIVPVVGLYQLGPTSVFVCFILAYYSIEIVSLYTANSRRA